MLVAMKPQTPTIIPTSSDVERTGFALSLDEDEDEVAVVDNGGSVWYAPLDVVDSVPSKPNPNQHVSYSSLAEH